MIKFTIDKTLLNLAHKTSIEEDIDYTYVIFDATLEEIRFIQIREGVESVVATVDYFEY